MSPIRKLRSLLRRSRLDAEMAEEMRQHVEWQAERNLKAGMHPDEARYAALRQFGNVARVQEQAREGRGWVWLEQFGQDVRFGARMLRKNPAFASVAVLSLAIGIGLNTAVFSIINTVFYQTIRGVPEPRRVLIFNEGGASFAGYRLLREQANDVAAIAAARSVSAVVEGGGGGQPAKIVAVSADYFTVLGARTSLGRSFPVLGGAAATDYAEPEAVVAHAFWETHLGRDPAVLGRVLRVNGTSVTVVGVAASDFHGPGPEGPAMWVPLGWFPVLTRQQSPPPRDSVGLIGRLRPGVSLEQAQAAVTVIAARSPEIFGATHYRLSLGREDWRGEVSPEKRVEFVLVTTVPLVAVGGLLWIACSNVGTLLFARAMQRRKEIAIRIAGGASRMRLVRMLMIESLLLALLGGAAGLWMSQATLDFVFATLSEFGALSVQLDGHVLLYTAAVSVVASVLFGLVPALEASGTDVSGALKADSGQPSFRGRRLRAFFLASQIATSVALLVVAGTYLKTLIAGAYVGPQGRMLDHLVIAQLPASRDAASRGESHRAILGQTRLLPGIEAAAIVEFSPAPRVFTRPGEPAPQPGKEVKVGLHRIDSNYARVVGLALRGGSMLTPQAAEGGLREGLVNKAMLDAFWAEGEGIGARFDLDGEPFAVVGVVDDGYTRPVAYTQLPLVAERVGLLVRTRGKAREAVPLIAGMLRKHTAENEFLHVAPLRETAFRFVSVMARLGGYLGGLALLLAAAGVYASTSFSTGQRTREIGVRMALGASRRSVLALVLGGGLKVIGGGAAAGLVLALIGLRLLTGLTGGSGSGLDIVAIVSVIAFFAVVAAAACLVPAWRGARVNPVEALRAE
jgi:predicted permease